MPEAKNSVDDSPLKANATIAPDSKTLAEWAQKRIEDTSTNTLAQTIERISTDHSYLKTMPDADYSIFVKALADNAGVSVDSVKWIAPSKESPTRFKIQLSDGGIKTVDLDKNTVDKAAIDAQELLQITFDSSDDVDLMLNAALKTMKTNPAFWEYFISYWRYRANKTVDAGKPELALNFVTAIKHIEYQIFITPNRKS